MRTLWCRKCSHGYASVAGDVPRVCPACDQKTVWSTLAPTTVDGWTLTLNDRRFLKAIGVEADHDHLGDLPQV